MKKYIKKEWYRIRKDGSVDCGIAFIPKNAEKIFEESVLTEMKKRTSRLSSSKDNK